MISYGLAQGDCAPEKIVWDQYRVWKENVPKLYSHLSVHPTEWPALSLEWLPEDDCMDELGYSLNYLLLGTQAFDDEDLTAEQQQWMFSTGQNEKEPAPRTKPRSNSSKIYNLEVTLPSESDMHRWVPEAPTHNIGRCTVKQCLKHHGEVNALKHMPQNPHIVASRGPVRGSANSTICPVYIYYLDMARDLTQPGATEDDLNPVGNQNGPREIDSSLILNLTGHRSEGMALSWNKKKDGQLASGADDGLVLVWDLSGPLAPASLAGYENGGAKSERGINPLCVMQGHEGAVQAVDFHPLHQHLLFSASDDRCIRIWDTRLADKGSMTNVRNAHSSAINCIQAHPTAEHVIATAGKDVVKIWDMRFERRSEPAMTLRGHTGEILSLEWAPHREDVLATGSMDRTVIVWNMERNSQPEGTGNGRIDLCPWLQDTWLGQYLYPPPKPEPMFDDMHIPKEVMFVHFGHTAPVTDISWNPNEDWVMASASQDNFLHVWKMAQHVYDEEADDEDGDYDLMQEMRPAGAAIANIHIPQSGEGHEFSDAGEWGGAAGGEAAASAAAVASSGGVASSAEVPAEAPQQQVEAEAPAEGQQQAQPAGGLPLAPFTAQQQQRDEEKRQQGQEVTGQGQGQGTEDVQFEAN